VFFNPRDDRVPIFPFSQGDTISPFPSSETVQNASFLPEELEAQRAAAEYEICGLGAKPEVILPEILHHIAYDGKGFGNSLLCPEDHTHLIDALLMRHFMGQCTVQNGWSSQVPLWRMKNRSCSQINISPP
jgi:Insulinase (Peptidase family M16)